MSLSDLSPVERLLIDAKRANMLDQWGPSLEAADLAMQLEPANADAMFLAGFALMKMGSPGLSMQMFHMASKAKPTEPSIWVNLGCMLLDHHPEEAYKAFMKAEALEPGREDVASNLCSAAGCLGRYAEAVEWADKVFKHNPNDRKTRHNAAESLLSLGRWEEGWRRYSAALGNDQRVMRNYHNGRQTPLWNPRNDSQKRVIIYGEQGIGDEILFASMLDRAIATGVEIALDISPRLAGLFARAFPEAEVHGTLSHVWKPWVAEFKPDAALPIGQLGEHFAPAPFTRGPFLKADAARVASARAWLDAVCEPGKRRIGIAWTGGAWETGRLRRSIPMEMVFALLRQKGIEWVCLEYEDPGEALELAPARVHHPKWLTAKGVDYDDTAALVSALDLVIAPTTSVVDLCGALGVPVWALAPPAPQWRYAEAAGTDSMFIYKDARVFRQKPGETWAPVIQRVARALAADVQEKAA